MGFFVGFSNHFVAPVPHYGGGPRGGAGRGGRGQVQTVTPGGAEGAQSCARSESSLLMEGLQVWGNFGGTCEQAVKVPQESHHHPIWQWV